MNPLFDEFRKAQSRLSRRDPILRKVVKTVGACTLQPNPDGFNILVRAIISQMISTKAAASIAARLARELCPDGLKPGAILAASVEKLRGVGLSGSKVCALLDLAGRVESGLLPLDDLARRTDEEVVSLLTPVRGIGTWTAQMFLIFSLGRLDVLPVDDLGLRAGVRDVYGLPEMPGRAYLMEAAEKWQPYRTVATWYFWKSRGFAPQSE
jgi:DNA-3-methyladenine glycosylase II